MLELRSLTQMEEWVEQYFSWSEEALVALGVGGNWEYVPESEYGGIPIFAQNDEERWYRYEVFFGSEIENGTPYITEWALFECGDFDFHERHSLTPNGERDLAKRLFKESDDSWLRYMRWVYDTGKDPMRELNGIVRQRRIKQKWQFRIVRSIVGIILKDARINGRGAWKSPKELPEHVKQFFLLKRIGDRWVVFGELSRKDRPTFSETFQKGQRLFSKDGHAHFKNVCEIDVTISVSKENLRRQIRSVAKNILKRGGAIT